MARLLLVCVHNVSSVCPNSSTNSPDGQRVLLVQICFIFKGIIDRFILQVNEELLDILEVIDQRRLLICLIFQEVSHEFQKNCSFRESLIKSQSIEFLAELVDFLNGLGIMQKFNSC